MCAGVPVSLRGGVCEREREGGREGRDAISSEKWTENALWKKVPRGGESQSTAAAAAARTVATGGVNPLVTRCARALAHYACGQELRSLMRRSATVSCSTRQVNRFCSLQFPKHYGSGICRVPMERHSGFHTKILGLRPARRLAWHNQFRPEVSRRQGYVMLISSASVTLPILYSSRNMGVRVVFRIKVGSSC